jgi:hypothetical protein
MVAIIIFICHPSRFDKFRDEMHNELINELRNIPVPSTPPAPGINVPRTYLYQDSVLYEMKRYPSVKFVDDPVTMKRTITVIEDLAWVLPVKGGEKEKFTKERELACERRSIRFSRSWGWKTTRKRKLGIVSREANRINRHHMTRTASC